MKINLRDYSDNILIFLNSLITFLLIFDSDLEIPFWLQTFGRLHPMLLHFPIVLLLTALFLDFVHFKIKEENKEFYARVVSAFFLIGIFLAGLTAIMGIFLSKEEGYAGDTLLWHKWTGVSIVYLSSLIYKLRCANWYKRGISHVGALILSLTIVLAGHFGASLTHGENYVLEPLSSPAVVPIEQALVFDHVILPILQSKCVSCHNDKKLKGELKLSDSLSILKGGKSGKLFVPGNPEISLLLERLHMPLSEKKHMPPSGKPQLSPDELSLLFLWIKDHPEFNKKVIDLSIDDSLRVLASSRLKPQEFREKKYEFASADAQTIKKLNSFYRLVSPVSHGSPALSVSFFNRNAFNSKALEDLLEIKNQIVSLSLSRMPVNDEDLKIISKFKELERLDLNFSDIKGSGLKELMTLKKLKTLSLSGTSVNLPQVLQVAALTTLSELTVWNTSLSEKDLLSLKKVNNKLQINIGFKDDGTNPIKLSKPLLKNTIRVFKNQSSLQLVHPIKSAVMQFTLDGKDPDSLNSPIFEKPVTIKENTLIKVKAFGKGWISSDVNSFTFYKSSYRPDSITILNPADESFKANGANTLIDSELGDFDINSNKWLGFRVNDLSLLVEFKETIKISSVALNTMIAINSSVFPPSRIEVYGGSDKNNLTLLSAINPRLPLPKEPQDIILNQLKFKPVSVSFLKIVAKPVSRIPSWHPGKGRGAFILFDELLLN